METQLTDAQEATALPDVSQWEIEAPGEQRETGAAKAMMCSNALIKLASAAGVLFAFSAILYGLLPEVGFFRLAEGILGPAAVISTLIMVAIGAPLGARARRTMVQSILAGMNNDSRKQVQSGEWSPSPHEYEESFQITHLAWCITRRNCACSALGGIAAGMTSLAAHDALMAALGNPWADLLTIALTLAALVIFGTVFAWIGEAGFKKEPGYQDAKDTSQQWIRNLAQMGM